MEANEERERLRHDLQQAQAEVAQLRKAQTIRMSSAMTQQQMIERLAEREEHIKQLEDDNIRLIEDNKQKRMEIERVHAQIDKIMGK